ncbi:hypothetical protein NLM24_32605 [Nocardia zapadnayensis]|uniref:hypothetical protein n=1 Tax=Nocardia rhamnosiphila TaxID=426716 RepID=UPI002247C08C|nr:hypothetical protein [Nocardia zapadnayensis]MCX0275334.1 hypothetical protein [Nocardia zapadnayensis]
MSALLRARVAYTGDVDTGATIALAAASLSPHVTQDLPRPLLEPLENGRYGRDHLAGLDAGCSAEDGMSRPSTSDDLSTCAAIGLADAVGFGSWRGGVRVPATAPRCSRAACGAILVPIGICGGT